jgi:protein involved in temperature-dependent protein secretion
MDGACVQMTHEFTARRSAFRERVRAHVFRHAVMDGPALDRALPPDIVRYIRWQLRPLYQVRKEKNEK